MIYTINDFHDLFFKIACKIYVAKIPHFLRAIIDKASFFC